MLLPRTAEGLSHFSVYAHKGEMTYCENGHPLGRFTRDVRVGEFGTPEALECEPGVQFGILECPVCHGKTNDFQCYYFEGVPSKLVSGATK